MPESTLELNIELNRSQINQEVRDKTRNIRAIQVEVEIANARRLRSVIERQIGTLDLQANVRASGARGNQAAFDAARLRQFNDTLQEGTRRLQDFYDELRVPALEAAREPSRQQPLAQAPRIPDPNRGLSGLFLAGAAGAGIADTFAGLAETVRSFRRIGRESAGLSLSEAISESLRESAIARQRAGRSTLLDRGLNLTEANLAILQRFNLGGIGGRLLVGGAAGVGGLAILGTLSEATQRYGTYESAVSRTTATLRLQREAANALEREIRNLGAQTAFTAVQSSEAATFLGQAGLVYRDVISALPTTLDVALVTGLDLGNTADILSNVATTLGFLADEYEDLADIIVLATNLTNTNFAQFAQALRTSGGLALSVGLDIQDLAAIIGVLSNEGLQAELAGNAVNRAIRAMYNPSNQAREILERLGFQMVDTGNRSADFLENLRRFTGLPLTITEQFAVLGTEGVNAFRILGTQSQTILQLAEQFRNADGALSDFVETLEDTQEIDVARLGSAFDALLTNIGRLTSPAFRSGIQSLTNLLSGLNTVVTVLFGAGGQPTRLEDVERILADQSGQGTLQRSIDLLRGGSAIDLVVRANISQEQEPGRTFLEDVRRQQNVFRQQQQILGQNFFPESTFDTTSGDRFLDRISNREEALRRLNAQLAEEVRHRLATERLPLPDPIRPEVEIESPEAEAERLYNDARDIIDRVNQRLGAQARIQIQTLELRGDQRGVIQLQTQQEIARAQGLGLDPDVLAAYEEALRADALRRLELIRIEEVQQTQTYQILAEGFSSFTSNLSFAIDNFIFGTRDFRESAAQLVQGVASDFVRSGIQTVGNIAFNQLAGAIFGQTAEGGQGGTNIEQQNVYNFGNEGEAVALSEL